MKVCIVGASGKLGRYMVRHAMDHGHEVVCVCREKSVGKLDAFKGRVTVVPGATNDREVISKAVSDCDGVLTVLVPWGVQQYATGTAQAVLDFARPGARLVFSCGWHITRDGRDVYPWKLRAFVPVFRWLARLTRIADLDDQVEACRRIFASHARWTVVRGSDLEEGESEGLPVWSPHVGDPVLESNITRRVDFALFMVTALANDELIHEAPAIVSRQSPSALDQAKAAGVTLAPMSDSHPAAVMPAPGKIILLNGASSSGKSTLAAALQAALDEPFWHYSIDHLLAARILPSDRIERGHFAWNDMRSKFFAGFHASLPAFASAGNNLIVEHIVESQAWMNRLVGLLRHHDVFFVGLHCPLDELERRERARADRRAGEAKADFETTHSFCLYDFEIGSTAPAVENAAKVIAAWKHRTVPNAFARLAGRQSAAPCGLPVPSGIRRP